MSNRRRVVLMVGLMWFVLMGCRGAGSGSPAAVAPAGLSSLAPTPSSASGGSVAQVPSPEDDIPRIDVWDLWERLQGGEAVVVVDTRAREAYDLERIPGAVSMPADEIQRRLGELPRDRLIVFYCT